MESYQTQTLKSVTRATFAILTASTILPFVSCQKNESFPSWGNENDKGNRTERRDLSLYDPLTGNPINRETANCYIVRSTGDYEFPMVYGNAITNGSENISSYIDCDEAIAFNKRHGYQPHNLQDHCGMVITSPWIKENKNVSDNLSATVLWEETEGQITDISIHNNHILFTCNQLESNAVIALKDGDTIIWSWHIWATGLQLSTEELIPGWNTTGGSYHDSYVILSHNIGATRNNISGCYYNWGRKDPFSPIKLPRTVNVPINTTKTAAELITKPDEFYRNLNDLYNNPLMNNLWDNSDQQYNSRGNSGFDIMVHKTIYDPSPIGFSLPEYGAFRSLDSHTVEETGVVFSAGGRLNNLLVSEVIILAKGTHGYYWTSVHSLAGKAYCMHLYEESNTCVTAAGCNIRCQKLRR